MEGPSVYAKLDQQIINFTIALYPDFKKYFQNDGCLVILVQKAMNGWGMHLTRQIMVHFTHQDTSGRKTGEIMSQCKHTAQDCSGINMCNHDIYMLMICYMQQHMKKWRISRPR